MFLKSFDKSEFCQYPFKYISMIVYEDITISWFVVEDNLYGPNSQCSYGIFIPLKHKYFSVSLYCYTYLFSMQGINRIKLLRLLWWDSKWQDLAYFFFKFFFSSYKIYRVARNGLFLPVYRNLMQYYFMAFLWICFSPLHHKKRCECN